MPETHSAYARKKRENHLGDPKTLRTDGMGEEYFIEKADQTAGKAGGSQKKGSGDKTLLFDHGSLQKTDFIKNIF